MPSRRELANALRVLSIDAVQCAQSGHPGAPLGMADIAEVLWNDFLKHNPANPNWDNRDRFIMSNGHGVMLLYALLHLTGYALSLDALKQFRQLHSETPGHPEYGITPGVEATTGPLGQGLACAVGMALAEAVLAATFNREAFDIVDHHTFVTVGDGCLMEGISHEVCSLAGTLGLGKLIAIYDSNKISIDGDVKAWFTEDIAARFEAYQWQVIGNVDGHDAAAIKTAVAAALANTTQPTIICCDTIIGWGSPNKAGSAVCHGAPLGADEVLATRAQLGWQHPPFSIPDEYYRAWDATQRGQSAEAEWQALFSAYAAEYPDLAVEYSRRQQSLLPDNWQDIVTDYVNSCVQKAESIATRKASQNAIEAFAKVLPELIGGSADLTASNLTHCSSSVTISKTNKKGNYIAYGVREFAMAAINNGIALHRGFIPYAGTFLIFSEYARNALRMAALMQLKSIFVFTHDSIGLGEDGPTHQAVEQTATLRLIPNMSLWRPADAVESAVAWAYALARQQGPSCLLFSRQPLAPITRDKKQSEQIRYGGYIMIHGADNPAVIIIATGSELQIAINVATKLNAAGNMIRVVSMPSTDVFEQQSSAYKETVLPKTCSRRIAIEAGVTDYWRKYVGLAGIVLGVDDFGLSAPADVLFKHFGLDEATLEKAVNTLLAQ